MLIENINVPYWMLCEYGNSLHNRENMSIINNVLRSHQYPPASAFHNNERRGVALDLGSAPGRGRGVNSGFGERAGIPRTRLPLKSPGLDLIFSAKYLGGI